MTEGLKQEPKGKSPQQLDLEVHIEAVYRPCTMQPSLTHLDALALHSSYLAKT